DLITFLQKMGASVERTYPDTIEVSGRKRLRGAEHKVMPDRIEAGTFAVPAGATGAHVVIEGADCDTMSAFIEVLGRTGMGVSCGTERMEIDARSVGPGAFKPVDVETGAYPGFATDIQPPTSVLLTQAAGRSRIRETIFEDRLEWLAELRKMGADVKLKSPHEAWIE